MATIINRRDTERMNQNNRAARAKFDQSLHRLEHSMDDLADHLEHTHNRVGRVRSVFNRPRYWAQDALADIRESPSAYIGLATGIATALGVIFYMSSQRAKKRRP